MTIVAGAWEQAGGHGFGIVAERLYLDLKTKEKQSSKNGTNF